MGDQLTVRGVIKQAIVKVRYGLRLIYKINTIIIINFNFFGKNVQMYITNIKLSDVFIKY